MAGVDAREPFFDAYRRIREAVEHELNDPNIQHQNMLDLEARVLKQTAVMKAEQQALPAPTPFETVDYYAEDAPEGLGSSEPIPIPEPYAGNLCNVVPSPILTPLNPAGMDTSVSHQVPVIVPHWPRGKAWTYQERNVRWPGELRNAVERSTMLMYKDEGGEINMVEGEARLPTIYPAGRCAAVEDGVLVRVAQEFGATKATVEALVAVLAQEWGEASRWPSQEALRDAVVGRLHWLGVPVCATEAEVENGVFPPGQGPFDFLRPCPVCLHIACQLHTQPEPPRRTKELRTLPPAKDPCPCHNDCYLLPATTPKAARTAAAHNPAPPAAAATATPYPLSAAAADARPSVPPAPAATPPTPGPSAEPSAQAAPRAAPSGTAAPPQPPSNKGCSATCSDMTDDELGDTSAAPSGTGGDAGRGTAPGGSCSGPGHGAATAAAGNAPGSLDGGSGGRAAPGAMGTTEAAVPPNRANGSATGTMETTVRPDRRDGSTTGTREATVRPDRANGSATGTREATVRPDRAYGSAMVQGVHCSDGDKQGVPLQRAPIAGNDSADAPARGAAQGPASGGGVAAGQDSTSSATGQASTSAVCGPTLTRQQLMRQWGWIRQERDLFASVAKVFLHDPCTLAGILPGRTCRHVHCLLQAPEDPPTTGRPAPPAADNKPGTSNSTGPAADEGQATNGKKRRAAPELGSTRSEAVNLVLRNYKKQWEGKPAQPARKPCWCEGPCQPGTCACVQQGLFCDRRCGCFLPGAPCLYVAGCTCAGPCKTTYCPCRSVQRECDPLLCRSCNADTCSYMDLRLGHHKNLSVRPSTIPGAGYGVFTLDACKAGDCLGQYTGEILLKQESDRRAKAYDRGGCSYLFVLDNETDLDAMFIGNKLRYANHGNPGNATTEVRLVDGERQVGMFARVDICAGQEILYNYGYTHEMVDHQQYSFVHQGATSSGTGRGRKLV